MITVGAYIAMSTEFESEDHALKAVEAALGFPFDSWVALEMVVREDSLGAVVDCEDQDWFGPDLQVILFTVTSEVEIEEEEAYTSDWVQHEDGTETPVLSFRMVPVTREVSTRMAVSYVR